MSGAAHDGFPEEPGTSGDTGSNTRIGNSDDSLAHSIAGSSVLPPGNDPSEHAESDGFDGGNFGGGEAGELASADGTETGPPHQSNETVFAGHRLDYEGEFVGTATRTFTKRQPCIASADKQRAHE